MSAVTRIGLLGVLAALLLAPAASAHSGHPVISPSSDYFSFERRAVTMAKLLWRPQCGRIEVSWEIDTGESEGGTGWAYAGECVVHLNVDKIELGYWEPFCTTILHEVGHIAGREHTATGLMARGRLYSLMEFQPSERQRRRAGNALPRWVTSVTGGNWRCDKAGLPWLRLQPTMGLPGGLQIPGPRKQLAGEIGNP